jgi:hypothetical protein
MISGKRGIAGLFDALLFLAIVSVVSAALLSAFSHQAAGPLGREQDRVEAAHTVLLRSTVVDGAGNSLSVEELFKIEAVEQGEYDVRLGGMLEHLLSGMRWCWTVQHDDHTFTIGSADLPGMDEPLFCSKVSAPLEGGEVTFRLEAWAI